ncbi:MAG: hypothetical protein HY290_14380 [Planctomycetia bacterium]|nr:hypothetical protein [Planctomycetia bacterium]
MTALTCFLAGPACGEDNVESKGTDCCCPDVVTKTYQSKGWLVQESEAFCVCCSPRLAEAKHLANACEALRVQLQKTWIGSAGKEWSPRCEIVVHATVNDYVRALGPGSRQSAGCTTIDLQDGKVVKRRIDLRADADDWMTTALPHELTHVVLADKFTEKQIPRWADEGMAILAEPLKRQGTRRTAMQQALTRIARYRAQELISTAEYPTGERRDAFYGQSASLVAFLIERDSPTRFLEFVQLGQEQGYEKALAETYGIKSLAQLDGQWHSQIANRGQTAELFASRIARITVSKRVE